MEAFQLKHFFTNPERAANAGTISASYAELMTLGELFAWEPGLQEQYLAHSLAYTAMNGGRDLRNEILRHIGMAGDASIRVVSGTEEAIFLVMMAVLRLARTPSPHVIVHTPCYQSLTDVPRMLGAEVSAWPSNESDNWAPSLAHLRTLLRKDTAAVVVNFPHNPTGFHPDDDYKRALVDIVEHSGAVLISDEVYAGLELNAACDFTPLAAISKRAASIGSTSKALGMPGLRIGWIATQHDALAANLAHLHEFTNTYPSQGSELIARAALKHATRIVARNRAIALDHHAQLLAFLGGHPKHFTLVAPVCGVVCFPRVTTIGARALSDRVYDQTGYLLAHSSVMQAGDAHIRIGFGTRTFARALPALAQVIDRL